LIFVFSSFASVLGLVDEPDHRKHHHGDIPLIGGIAFTGGTLIAAAFVGLNHHFTITLILTSLFVLLVGVLDDRYDLRISVRFSAQALAVLVVIYGTGVRVNTLGELWGHALTLGWMSTPFTIIAVIGLINAMNMMDGIDGLAGGLALVAAGAIVALMHPLALSQPLVLILLLSAATLPYLARNLGPPGRKVFMGDAGSTVLGYLVAWTLIWLSNAPEANSALTPGSVLWCIALPVMDTCAVMIRRLRAGLSPFKPDRGHIHHLLMARGLGVRQTLLALLILSGSFALIGAMLKPLPESYSLVGFLCTFILYLLATRRLAQASEQQTSPQSSMLQLVVKRGLEPPKELARDAAENVDTTVKRAS